MEPEAVVCELGRSLFIYDRICPPASYLFVFRVGERNTMPFVGSISRGAPPSLGGLVFAGPFRGGRMPLDVIKLIFDLRYPNMMMMGSMLLSIDLPQCLPSPLPLTTLRGPSKPLKQPMICLIFSTFCSIKWKIL